MVPYRRRKNNRDDDEEVLEALLPRHDDSTVGSQQHEDSRVLVKGPEQDVNDEVQMNMFMLMIMQSWNCLLACLSFILGQRLQLAPSFTNKQETRIQDLRARITVPYKGEDPAHLVSLKTLWSLGFPNDAWIGVKNPKWKDMGWQGEDPGTDFRGGGYMALTNLLYMAQCKKPLFAKLMNKTEGTRAEWEYPFAAAGVNVTVGLIDSLQLRGTTLPHTAQFQGFMRLLEDSDMAFEELYCCTFELLDEIWLDMHASYMQFPIVIRKTIKVMEAALAKQPRDFQELEIFMRSR